MKLTHLRAEGFLGIASLELALPTPVTLFSGPNGAGKSSVRDGLKLALTGELTRVSLKKDAASLVRTGSKSAKFEATTDMGERFSFAITGAGKVTETRTSKDAEEILPYVLEAQRFAGMPEKERRSFLFGLMGLKLSPKEIGERMVAKGCDKKHVDRIAPLLRSGFEAAHIDAKEQAAQARADWKAVAGEVYGSEKAASWEAAKPAYDAAAHAVAQQAVQAADAALAGVNQRLGALQANKKHRDEQLAKLPDLQARAARTGRITDKLAADELALARLEGDIARATAAAGTGPRIGLVHDLASAVAYLLAFADDTVASDDARASLQAYETAHGKVGATTGDPAAARRVTELQAARTLCTSAINNDKRDLRDAETAASQAKDITDQAAAQPIDSAALAALVTEVAKLQADRTAAVGKADALKAAKDAIANADKATTEASAHHAAVEAWVHVASVLAPDGIPGEILAEALGPINARLTQSALDSGWPAVVIAPDMLITAGGRAYALLSASQQWRCDAMLAEAVSHLSGIRLLVLDGFDVLQPSARPELLGWLDALAAAGEVDTALIFGTLQLAPPDGVLPDTITAHWIEGGCIKSKADLTVAA